MFVASRRAQVPHSPLGQQSNNVDFSFSPTTTRAFVQLIATQLIDGKWYKCFLHFAFSCTTIYHQFDCCIRSTPLRSLFLSLSVCSFIHSIHSFIKIINVYATRASHSLRSVLLFLALVFSTKLLTKLMITLCEPTNFGYYYFVLFRLSIRLFTL